MRARVVALALAFALCAIATATVARADEIRDRYVLILSRHGIRSATQAPATIAAWANEPWPSWGVGPGDLTARGASVATHLGTYYRALLAGDALVAAHGCGDASHVFVTADVDQRTVATAQAYAAGMFPGCGLAVHHVAAAPDALYHPAEAGVVSPDRARAAAEMHGRFGADLAGPLQAYAPELALAERATGVPLPAGAASIGRGATLAEIFQLEYADGMPATQIAWGRLSAADLLALGRLREFSYDMSDRMPYAAATGASNLLAHLTASLDRAGGTAALAGALDPPGTHLTVAVGHDGNVAQLAALLRVGWALPGYQPNDAAPTGALVFRVGTRASDGATVVRLAYVAPTLEQMRADAAFSLAQPPASQQLFIPGCSDASDGYPCPLARFDALAAAAIDPHFVVK
jgi:4-phytase/acid phosphatase